ncbi:hypothetical protein ID866_8122 [Astraeus odoratus]|nr:hypothetical protein ID866_8122 [Astraeus odoratus]
MSHNFVMNHIIDMKFHFNPTKLLDLGVTYNVCEFFEFEFKQLVECPLTWITKEHHLLIGPKVYAGVAISKTILDKHCHLIVAEEPPALVHSDDCHDHKGCEEDWHITWWNEVGHFLLNGRNPQPYSDAVKNFKELHFRCMSISCKTKILYIIDSGMAFGYADKFVEEICSGLVGQVIYEPPLSPHHLPL